MASATMGLRRRTQIGSSPVGGAASASSSSNGSGSGSSSAGSKRTRSDNNNSPSQGNLNSPPEPAAKKTRSSAACNTRSSARAKEQLEQQVKKAPPPWSDRSLASIAGLALGGQSLQLPDSVAASLSSPLANFINSSMATFVGNATAAGLGKGTSPCSPTRPTPSNNANSSWAADADAVAKAAAAAVTGSLSGLPFPPFGALKKESEQQKQQPSSPQATASAAASATATTTTTAAAATTPTTTTSNPPESLPKNFPNDSMFATYQPWVIKTYGDLAKTKTITIKKYARILRTLRGEEVNSAENSKFRFWVKSKGFHIGQPEGYDAKPADRIVGRHAVTSPGLDPPLYVPTQPPHNKSAQQLPTYFSSYFNCCTSSRFVRTCTSAWAMCRSTCISYNARIQTTASFLGAKALKPTASAAAAVWILAVVVVFGFQVSQPSQHQQQQDYLDRARRGRERNASRAKRKREKSKRERYLSLIAADVVLRSTALPAYFSASAATAIKVPRGLIHTFARYNARRATPYTTWYIQRGQCRLTDSHKAAREYLKKQAQRSLLLPALFFSRLRIAERGATSVGGGGGGELRSWSLSRYTSAAAALATACSTTSLGSHTYYTQAHAEQRGAKLAGCEH
ncbi:unnamed protein product [Trichogramma brassicae]|uniref:Nucleolar protein 4 n=1 Tax=Trichogramma brassicae TaxID=86971 RepID=A0A6H5IAH6_9HYME|nr:unnamed protein product [Trichogramma brassicae]